MISSVDPAQVGAALMTQNDAVNLTKMSSVAPAQNSTTSFLPMSTTSSTSSMADTLNGLVTMLQNLLASIGTMFGGGNGGTQVGTPGIDTSGKYDFLRQVDQEPVTVIPPSNKKPGASHIGDISYDNEVPTVVGDQKESGKTESKKQEIGTALKKSNGEFLWKPQSDKDGKLAILLPKGLTGKVKGVQILSPDGTKVLGKGKFSGVGNGEREHFRFGKAGGGYPDGAIVVITLEDGSKRHVTIKETSDRTTR